MNLIDRIRRVLGLPGEAPASPVRRATRSVRGAVAVAVFLAVLVGLQVSAGGSDAPQAAAQPATAPAASATSGPAQPAGEARWSQPVRGLQARIVMKRAAVFGGTQMIDAFLELQNVSDKPIYLPWWPGDLNYWIVNGEGNAVPLDRSTMGNFLIPNRGILTIHPGGSQLLNACTRGWGVPSGKAGMVGPWIFDNGDGRQYFLKAVLTVGAELPTEFVEANMDKPRASSPAGGRVPEIVEANRESPPEKLPAYKSFVQPSTVEQDGNALWHGRIDIPPALVPLTPDPINLITAGPIPGPEPVAQPLIGPASRGGNPDLPASEPKEFDFQGVTAKRTDPVCLGPYAMSTIGESNSFGIVVGQFEGFEEEYAKWKKETGLDHFPQDYVLDAAYITDANGQRLVRSMITVTGGASGGWFFSPVETKLPQLANGSDPNAATIRAVLTPGPIAYPLRVRLRMPTTASNVPFAVPYVPVFHEIENPATRPAPPAPFNPSASSVLAQPVGQAYLPDAKPMIGPTSRASMPDLPARREPSPAPRAKDGNATWIAAVDGGDKANVAYVLNVSRGKVVSGEFIVTDSRGLGVLLDPNGNGQLPPDRAQRVPIQKLQHDGNTVSGEIELKNAQEPTGESHFTLTIALSGSLQGADHVTARVRSNDDREGTVVVFTEHAAAPGAASRPAAEEGLIPVGAKFLSYRSFAEVDDDTGGRFEVLDKLGFLVVSPPEFAGRNLSVYCQNDSNERSRWNVGGTYQFRLARKQLVGESTDANGMRSTYQLFTGGLRDLAAVKDPVGILEFRIAPSSWGGGRGPALDAGELKGYRDWLDQGKTGLWWKEPNVPGIAGRMPKYLWLPAGGDANADYDRLIVGQHEGRTYLLVSDEPNRSMVPSADPNRAWGLKKVYSSKDQNGRPVVGFDFDARGAELFAALTGTNLKSALAIIVDGEVLSAPTIQSKISSSGIITGRFSQEDVDKLVKAIRLGMPPAAARPASAPAPQPVSAPAVPPEGAVGAAPSSGQKIVRSFPLKDANANAAADVLRPEYKTSIFVVDDRTNTLIVSAPADEMEKIAQAVARLDPAATSRPAPAPAPAPEAATRGAVGPSSESQPAMTREGAARAALAAKASAAPPRIAVYLVTNTNDTRLAEKATLGELELAKDPVLRDGDFVSYDANAQTLTVSADAAKRFPRTTSVWGMPYVVVVEGRRWFLGSYMPMGSSYMPKVPVAEDDILTKALNLKTPNPDDVADKALRDKIAEALKAVGQRPATQPVRGEGEPYGPVRVLPSRLAGVSPACFFSFFSYLL